MAVIALSNKKSLAMESVGFSRGNSLKIVNMSGSIKVRTKCDTRTKKPFTVINCESHDLTTGNEDYFIGPINNDARQVELIARSASGDLQVKSSDYDGSVGKSIEKINLWYSTLLQNPLLEVGSNQIQYIIKNENGQEIQRGVFNVQVQNLPAMECDQQTVHSLTFAECSMTRSICQKYFKQKNYCQK